MTTCLMVAPYGEREGSTEIHPNGFTSTDNPQYMVTFSDFFATAWMAQTASVTIGMTTYAVPAFGDTVGSFVLLGKMARRHPTDKRVWIVTCIYRIPLPSEEARNGRTEWAVDVNITKRPYEKEKQFYIDGTGVQKPLQNVVGDPITGVMDTFYDEEILVSVSRTNMPWATYDLYQGKANSEALSLILDRVSGNPRNFAIGTLKFDHYEMSMRPDVDGGVYPRAVLHLLYRKDGWNQKIANKGVRQIALSGPDIGLSVPIYHNGQEVTDPQYLHADGSPAAIGDAVVFIGGTAGIPWPVAEISPIIPFVLLV